MLLSLPCHEFANALNDARDDWPDLGYGLTPQIQACHWMQQFGSNRYGSSSKARPAGQLHGAVAGAQGAEHDRALPFGFQVAPGLTLQIRHLVTDPRR